MSEATRGSEPGEERQNGQEAGRQPPGAERESVAEPEVIDREAAAHRARESTEHVIRENRNFVADYLNSLSCALASMAETLAEEGRRESSGQVDRAARELGRASNRVRDESLIDLARETEERARAHPAVTFGGAALAGFALSRILKSSRSRESG